jgi:hypothetical protein
MVRIESPTQALPRTTMRDVELQRHRDSCRSRVMLLWGRGQPRRSRGSPTPNTFDIHRSAKRHLGFGHGITFASVRRWPDSRHGVAVRGTLSQLPRYRMAAEPVRFVSNWARAPWRALPVTPG